MAETSPGLELFQQSHERLLRQFLELERQKLPTDVIDKQLTDIAESIVRDFNTSALMVGKARLSDEDEREFRAQVRGIMGGGALVPLLEREDVENIHILGHDNVVLSLADGNRISAPPAGRQRGGVGDDDPPPRRHRRSHVAALRHGRADPRPAGWRRGTGCSR